MRIICFDLRHGNGQQPFSVRPALLDLELQVPLEKVASSTLLLILVNQRTVRFFKILNLFSVCKDWCESFVSIIQILVDMAMGQISLGLSYLLKV